MHHMRAAQPQGACLQFCLAPGVGVGVGRPSRCLHPAPWAMEARSGTRPQRVAPSARRPLQRRPSSATRTRRSAHEAHFQAKTAPLGPAVFSRFEAWPLQDAMGATHSRSPRLGAARLGGANGGRVKHAKTWARQPRSVPGACGAKLIDTPYSARDSRCSPCLKAASATGGWGLGRMGGPHGARRDAAN